jgi:hypothetical protein
VLAAVWVFVWIWLSNNLRRALGPTSNINSVLDYMVLGYLDWRAHAVLRKAGLEVSLFGPGLPEQPPVGFGQPQGTTPFAVGAVQESDAHRRD